MAKRRSSYMALLLPVFADLAFGKQMKQIHVCNGDSIQLFDSNKVKDNDTIVSLYINGENDRTFAIFDRGQPLFDYHEYANKLGLDGNMNLWILHVNQRDKGIYTLFSKAITANFNFSEEVDLYVLVPPASACKPAIRELGNNTFYASIQDENCGTPQASAYWLNSSSLHNEHRDVIKLPVGTNFGTYYACIEGPALKCARSSNQSMDHCQSITIHTNITQQDLGSSTNNIPWLLWVIFALQIILTLVFSGLLYILDIKKKKIKSMIIEVCSRCFKKGSAQEASMLRTQANGGQSDNIEQNEDEHQVSEV